MTYLCLTSPVTVNSMQTENSGLTFVFLISFPTLGRVINVLYFLIQLDVLFFKDKTIFIKYVFIQGSKKSLIEQRLFLNILALILGLPFLNSLIVISKKNNTIG
jgi:hypothetical protein